MIQFFLAGGRAIQPEVVQEVLADLKDIYPENSKSNHFDLIFSFILVFDVIGEHSCNAFQHTAKHFCSAKLMK